jgi:hypothetical protein
MAGAWETLRFFWTGGSLFFCLGLRRFGRFPASGRSLGCGFLAFQISGAPATLGSYPMLLTHIALL